MSAKLSRVSDILSAASVSRPRLSSSKVELPVRETRMADGAQLPAANFSAQKTRTPASRAASSNSRPLQPLASSSHQKKPESWQWSSPPGRMLLASWTRRLDSARLRSSTSSAAPLARRPASAAALSGEDIQIAASIARPQEGGEAAREGACGARRDEYVFVFGIEAAARYPLGSDRRMHLEAAGIRIAEKVLDGKGGEDLRSSSASRDSQA